MVVSFVFFFKQKTAYEMRISDWSSDVCSSDLPGVTDDPGLVNLVFTWTGDDFQTSGGPFSDIDFSGLTAVSTYGQIFTDGFSTLTVKNEGLGAEGTDLYTQGYVGVPGVPEPETWLMMIGGFGLVGWQLRRRKVRTEALA